MTDCFWLVRALAANCKCMPRNRHEQPSTVRGVKNSSRSKAHIASLGGHQLPQPSLSRPWHPALAIVGVVLATCAAGAAVRLVRECLCAATATGTSGRLIIHPLRIRCCGHPGGDLRLWCRWPSGHEEFSSGSSPFIAHHAWPVPQIYPKEAVYLGYIWGIFAEEETSYSHVSERTDMDRTGARQGAPSARSLVAVDVHCMYFSYA